MSVLDKITEVKLKLKSLAEDLLKEKMISQKEYEDFIASFEREKIRIGVVGQVKNGKSTLLNALIFQKPLLPTAATPMTASLSFITYADDENVEVEFYTEEDWSQIERIASGDSEDMFSQEIVQASRELVEMSKKIPEFKSLLGRKKRISFEELGDYVGEAGKYVPITKSIAIGIPNDRLKGVDFIDTPGYNDPVISRERRAMESLREADAVIVVLYAGRPFDEADKELIFKRLPGVGSGKVVLIVNKRDTILEDFGTEEKVKEYIEEKIGEFLDELEQENSAMSKVIKNSKIIPFSSLSALLGVMSDDDIRRDENLSWYYDKFKSEFSLKTKNDFVKFSRLMELESVLEEIIKKEKYDILVKKPATFIVGKWKERLGNLRGEKHKLESQKKAYNQSLKDIKKEQEKLEKVKKELGDFISEVEGKVSSELKELKRKHIDLVGKEFSSLSFRDIREKELFERHKNYSAYVSSEINSILSDFIGEIENKVNEHSKEAYELLKKVISEIDDKITDITAVLTFTRDDINKLRKEITELLNYNIGDIKFEKVEIETRGFWVFGTSAAKSEAISQASEQLREIKKSVLRQVDDHLAKIEQLVDGKIRYIRENYEKKVINPVVDELKEVENNYQNKQNELREIEKRLVELEKEIPYIESKVSEIEKEINSIF